MCRRGTYQLAFSTQPYRRISQLGDSSHAHGACRGGTRVGQRPAISPVRCSRSARRWTAAHPTDIPRPRNRDEPRMAEDAQT
jgi:hypothetical protein